MNQDDISGLPARKAALRLLDSVLRMGMPMDQATNAACKGLESADRALAIAIAQEVMRWLPDLDALIDSKTKQILPDDAKARTVIRMALAQYLQLKTPPHAAIATALPLVDGGPRKLVHGVLGALFRSDAKLPELPSVPEAAAMRWHAAWGDDMLEGAQVSLAQPPLLDISLRDPASTDEWTQRLGGTSLLPGHIRLPRGTAIEDIEGYSEGAWWVQDIAASLPARLIGNGEGRTVLDLCAAPGGKTMQLAAAGWQVTSIDSSGKRIERLEHNLHRTGLSAHIVKADVMHWQPKESVDAILLDAPCSATGTMRRHPDVLYRIGMKQINELAALQSAMLDRVTAWLKPGGTLVYATCSLEPHEGESQAAAFLSRHKDFTVNPVRTNERLTGVAASDRGYVRTMPPMLQGVGGLDGFFVARFVKSAAV
jgi:16S rRNA (cytosine967-C5)-methyltransferase